jgi:hypothetical protein
MNTINELLTHYELKLTDCEESWVEQVREFEKVKSAMPSNVAEKREKEIVDCFFDYHVIEADQAETVKTKKSETKVKTPSKAKKTQPASGAKYAFDEEAVMKKADDIIDQLF